MSDIKSFIQSPEEKKDTVLEATQSMIEAFGFRSGKRVSIEEIQQKMSDKEPFMHQSLSAVYGENLPNFLASDGDFQRAFILNIQKMVEFARVRKDGSPYFLHPITASQELLRYAPQDLNTLKAGAIGAILHDFLEEGDGVSRESVSEFQSMFSDLSADDVEGLVMLTEPNYKENGKVENPNLAVAVDYDALKQQTGFDRKQLEPVIFLIMARANRMQQLVIPVDKLANVGDCDIVQRKKALKDSPDATSPEFHKKFLSYMAKTLGTYALYAEGCIDSEAKQSKQALEVAIEEKIENMSKELPDLAEEVKKKTQEFIRMSENPMIHQAVAAELVPYLRGLGLVRSAERIALHQAR